MKQIALILSILLSGLNLAAQEIKFRETIDKDSLFNVSVKKLPEGIREEYIKAYKEGNKQAKEYFLFMISMPESSKRALIENYENRKTKILKLKEGYMKFVPENHVVYIEFEPESKILTIPEEITLKIYRKTNADKDSSDNNNSLQRNDHLNVVSQNWNLKPGSKELEEILVSIGWTTQTLTEIKKLLDSANCVSIENGNEITIGFARSGMGKYSYKIFEKPLSGNQKDDYDDGCAYIFHKDNVVLEYGGGAIGPQCFGKE